ncbi:MAG TPA: hypothetical protein VGK53_17455 [Propionicimonas sp.]|jgi:hypothetical protein
MTTHAWATPARPSRSRAEQQPGIHLTHLWGGPVLASLAMAIAITALILLVVAGLTDLHVQFGAESSVSQPRPSPVPQSPPPGP